MNILVLHGPNLNLLGERPGDEKGRTLAMLNEQIERRAREVGAEVRILQSNHEGALIDAIHDARRWADAIIINPGALTHTSYVLREALVAVHKPAIEVHLTDIRRRESWRRKSVIKDVCEAQILGKGFDSYLLAIDRLVGAKKKLVRESKRPADASKRRGTQAASKKPEARVEKTIGRQPAASAGGPATEFLTRALVRQKIADRLAGRITPSGLSTWARSKWLDVQRGAPAESGQRELLEDTLQQLVLSSMPPAKLTDDQLIELMTQLDG
ncbi:MAG: 3-dehydroquinate dehydratase [Myxococcaceae bacterium]|nr:3-dehydroquinate dehydratase [Myxococcaceae bacterium]